MRICRFDEDRLGLVEGEEVLDVTPALQAIPAACWPRPHGDALIANLDAVLERASSFYTLYPGDIILSGTPEGVGPVGPGDEIRAGIERVGEFTIRVAPDYAG